MPRYTYPEARLTNSTAAPEQQRSICHQTRNIAIAIVLFCSVAFGATFTVGQKFAANFPTDIAVADLNGDGKLDFIVGGYWISVYVGNGDGTFVLKQQYDVDGEYIRIADLNGDGILDFVASSGPGLKIYLGNGDGSFRTGASLPFFNIAIATPALGDFNHDGNPDIAVASYSTDQLQIFFGNGDGTFRPPVIYAMGIKPQFTLAVDLNQDGNLDLVVTSSGDGLVEAAGLSIFIGNPDGTFRPRSFMKQPDYTLNIHSIPTYLAARDFDGDGKIDLLVQASGDANTFILYGSGSGSFQATVAVATNAFGGICIPGDFDGDSKLDIVCAGDGFTIVTNRGDRTFSPTTYFPTGFSAVAAGDFNQDGKQDLILAGLVNSGDIGVFVYLNSRATTRTVVGVDQAHPQYGQLSHLTTHVYTDADGYNSGCFSTCPAGTITWFDGNVALATTPVTPASFPYHSGTATYDAYFLGGAHSITASYAGDEFPSTANTFTLQVFPAPATLAISTSPASPIYGAGVTVAVDVTAASQSPAAPTGTVAIQDNEAALVTLPLTTSGKASTAALSLSGGNHTIQAKYAGDSNYLSALASTSFAVQPGPVQITLTCAPNPAASDEPSWCTSRLSDTTATGSVTFADGAATLGSATVATGQAVLNVGVLAAGVHTVQASYSGDSNFTTAQAPAFSQTITSATQVVAIAAADGHPSLAPQAIGAAYGAGFSSSVAFADPGPLPATLGGVHITVTDATGAGQSAPLFFVSPNQINFLTPNLGPGPARVQISNGTGALYTGPLTIQTVSPALFSANGDGKGVAAAYVVHVGKDGVQSTQPVFACGKAEGSCVAVPIDLGKPSDENVLILYGSGIRSASKVSALFEARASSVAFFGPQGQFSGLDQVNVSIPANLAGHGDTHIALLADGHETNRLLLHMR